MSFEVRLQKHKDFWVGKSLRSPLISIRVGDAFISRQFKANEALLKRGKLVRPDDIDVDSYLRDYERMYQTHEQVIQDSFFTAEPISGFPWIEAICGCEVYGADVSFVTKHRFHSIDDLDSIQFSRDNPWYRKYLEFIEKLDKLAAGRFPLGQPILRGVTDTLGALVGQEEMACTLMTDPEKTNALFNGVVQLHRTLIEDAYKIIKPFHDGYAIGFYYIWAPGKVIWFQEDLSAILAPRHFDQYLRETANEICRGYDYTLEHLHPASFGHLEGILTLPGLKAVQINREDVGPSVAEIIPECKRVIAAGKRFVLFGPLDNADVDAIAEKLPNHGIALHCLTPTIESGNTLSAYIQDRFEKSWGNGH